MLVNRYQIIAFEELHTTNLVKRPKPKQDEATGQYLPNGAVVKKDLSERWHSCECGCELDRDTNAAINILHAAYHPLVGTWPTRATA
jgi:putative transposase